MRQLKDEYQAKDKTNRVNEQEHEQWCYHIPFCVFFKRWLAPLSEANVFRADIVDRKDLSIANRAGSVHESEIDIEALK